MNKNIFIILLLSFFTQFIYSQEICDNGIDDDSDGLVDMNDTVDCFCINVPVTVPSLIPNPSFEDTICCPISFSQMNCTQGWTQASTATPDYLNTCGVVFNAATSAGLVPFPDGNGIVGEIFAPTWQEYIGYCLPSPLLAGTPYTIQMSIVSTPIDGYGEVCNGGVINYTPIDIVIYGAANCSSLPFAGVECPPSPWYVMGTATYTPVDSWGTISISFTPTANVEAIIFGAPCTLPPSYTYGPCYPYFYYDNFILNQSSAFGLHISQTGGFCTNDLVLTVMLPDTGTVQWYYQGVAIVGQTGTTLNVTANGYSPGDYQAVFTNISGDCTIATFTVDPPVYPVITISNDTTICNEDSVLISAGGGTNFTWNNGVGIGNSQIVSPASTTTYYVTLTDNNNCTDSDSITVTVYPIPTSTFTTTPICENDTTLITYIGNAGPGATYNWSFPSGTPSVGSGIGPFNTVWNIAGTYPLSLSVVENGCSSIYQVNFEVMPQGTLNCCAIPITNAGTDFSVCDTNFNLQALPDIGLGTWTCSSSGVDIIDIHNPVTAVNISGGYGAYIFTWTENSGNGCENNDQVIVSVVPNPYIGVDTVIDAICYSSCTGSAVVFGIGGTAPYSYFWSASAGSVNDSVASSLCAGYHYVTITDDNGCYASESITISEPSELNIFITGIIDNNCYGMNTGEINIYAIGGTLPYNYIWSNGATTPNNSGLIAGNYSVSVIDANGCSEFINNISVGQANQLQVYINTTNAACNQSDGSATAIVGGGIPPYSYLWSNMTSLNPVTNIPAGYYSLIVIDGNGCMMTEYFSISNSGGFTLSANITDAVCFGDNSGAIDMNLSGGTAPFSISWSTGANTEDLTNLVAGAYDVIVTDFNNCMKMETFIVDEGAELVFTSSIINPTCSQSDGSISLIPSGGLSPYAFEWSNGANTSDITGLTAGNYLITITDANGCFTNDIIGLSNSGGPTITIDSLISAPCGGSGFAYISVAGGTLPYAFEWSDATTNEDLQNVSPGVYYVTVSDFGGCITVQNIEIPSIQLPIQPICVVTVDTMLSRNLVVWEKISASGVDYYKIYRETSIPDQYLHVGSVDYDDMSEYLDFAANPFVRSFRYKISSVDMCGNESSLSDYHKTLHLTINQGTGTTYNLIWDDYEGFPYYTFYIMRYLPASGWITLDSLPKTLHSYTDIPPSNGGLKYLVRINTNTPCVPTSSIKATGGPYDFSYSNFVNPDLSYIINLLNSKEKIEIYPNPMTVSSTIYFENVIGIEKIIITDISGKIIRIYKNIDDTQLIINKGNLSPGMYFIEARGEKLFKAKLIVE
ncbi:MAG: T9SS type A sorting domain-containing protein [Bacteroidota bacterium]